MRILLEGGNVFPDVTSFDHKDVPAILKTLNQKLFQLDQQLLRDQVREAAIWM